MTEQEPPPHLAESVRILRSCREDHLLDTPQQRDAVLAAIYDDFSERNLGEVLEMVLDGDRYRLLAEAQRARKEANDDGVAVARMTLTQRGWQFSE